jgi:hypothetical protein
VLVGGAVDAGADQVADEGDGGGLAGGDGDGLDRWVGEEVAGRRGEQLDRVVPYEQLEGRFAVGESVGVARITAVVGAGDRVVVRIVDAQDLVRGVGMRMPPGFTKFDFPGFFSSTA